MQMPCFARGAEQGIAVGGGKMRVIHAADDTDYSYVLDERGEACIARCSSTARRLFIPEYIDGHLVTSLGPSSFSGLTRVAEIRCPATVRRIGACAFAGCANLMALAFPDALDTFDISWVEGCARLQDVTFPGCAPVVPAELFGVCDVRVLRMGSMTQSVLLPSAHSHGLARIEIDAGNRFLRIEGPALFDYEKREVMALVGFCTRYEVPDGVKRIAPFAFAWHDELEYLGLPPSVEWVGEGAFAHTPALASIVLPACVCETAQRAIACTAERPDEFMDACDRAVCELADPRTRAQLMIARLADPLCLSASAEAAFGRQLSDDLPWLAVELAERNDLHVFSTLADVGVIDGASIADTIEALSPLRHAEAVAFLLNLAHERFDGVSIDFDL